MRDRARPKTGPPAAFEDPSIGPETPSADEPEGVRVPPRRFSRGRLRAFRAVERVCVALGGRALYRTLHLRRGRFLVREEICRVPDLPAALEGFTVAQVSDLHAGPFLGPGDLRDVVAAVDELAPDLVALTGDYVTHSWDEALLVADDLGRLRSRYGTFAVFGNHDYKHRQEHRIVTAYAERGVRFLRNAHVRIQVEQASLAVVGLEDLEEGRVVDLEGARSGLGERELELVLCHNPRGAQAIARPGCAAILSGHTHGGQLDLPWLRRLGPQHPGLRVELGPTTLIVSRGLGVVGVPLRVRAPAELVVLRLTRAAGGSDGR